MKCLNPDYEWLPWKFARGKGNGFWREPENVRRYLEWLGAKLGFAEPEDWYLLQTHDLRENHGGAVLRICGSLSALVRAGFPEHDWKEWWFNVVPPLFWDDRANVRRYLEWLGEELGLKTMADWYQLTADDVWIHRGAGLLERYNQSVAKMLTQVFPERGFKMEEFRRPPPDSWKDPAFCRRYLEKLGRVLGFKQPADWYRLKSRHFISHRGSALMHRFKGSAPAVLKEYMPEHDWKEWLFDCPPRRFWKDRRNRQRYLDWLADRLGIRDAEGWGRLYCRHFIKNKGTGLIKTYEFSVRDVILDTFPSGHPAVIGVLAVADRKRFPRRRSRP